MMLVYAKAGRIADGRIVLSTHKGTFEIATGEALDLIAQLSDALTGGFGEMARRELSHLAASGVQVAADAINEMADWPGVEVVERP